MAAAAAVAAAAASDATNAICRARFSSAHFTRRTDFQRSAALFGTRREEERKRELSPISATGGNRPTRRQVELMRSRSLDAENALARAWRTLLYARSLARVRVLHVLCTT